MMIAALLMMQTAAAGISGADRVRYEKCVAAARGGSADAIALANAWLVEGAGLPARHCLGLALLANGKPAAAARAFEAAARLAQSAGSPAAADLYGQAGNAAILASDWLRAETLLGAGIDAAKRPGLRGNLLIDRARARVAGNLPGARADLDEATTLLPQSPVAWLLSAAFARREERLGDARTAIARAAALAPRDPDVEVEQANIAALDGNIAEARRLWTAASDAAPDSAAGRAAADALAHNEN